MKKEINNILQAINKMNTKKMKQKDVKKLIKIKNELQKQLTENINNK